MRRPNLPISLAILVVLVFAVSISAGGVQAASGPDISPRLARALAAGDFPWLAEDGSLTVWVFFRDKGLAGAALDKALDEAQDSLGQRAAWRRAKMKTAGERLVDVRDLDLCAAYIDQATRTGAVLRRKSRWLNAASFQADPGQIRQLAGLDCVLRVDLVNKFSRPEIPVEPVAARPGPADKEAADRWDIDYGGNLAAMEQFNVPQVHGLGITGQGVLIGMLDAGFHPTHEALADIPVLATYDFVNDDENVDNEEGDPADSRNHGTMTMSTAMGNKPGAHVAPAFGASAVLAKTEDVSQEVPIEEDQWVAGLEWVETYGVDIVSSSLGYLDWYDWEDMDGATAVTTIAADLAVARGMVVVNSAGNERGTSWDHIIAPADGDSVIAVGAVSSNGEYTYFSSPGPSYDGRIKPDVAALGSNNHVADPNNDTGYTYASGTSFSCPLTSGVAALILCRAPDLTPLQVREALRETASRADAPDNDYGWGLIDAYAAVTYFGPNFQHVPLPDTEDVTGPYVLGMIISDREGLDEATARVHYRTDGGSWLEVPIMATGGGPQSYFAEIPGQVDGTLVDYYLEAASVSGITTRLPAKAPEQFFTFRVGQDLTLPLLSHTPLRDQALLVWPPVVSCRASDNLGIDRVELTFKRNGGLDHGPYALVPGEDDAYELEFPLAAQDLAVGDGISYTLTAFDSAGKPNIAVSGPHDFLIIDPLGVVLVLEDNQDEADGAEPDLKIDGSRKDKPHLIPEVGKSSAGTITTWLLDAGYVAEMIPAAGVTVEDFAGYQVVVLSAGDNTEPVADVATRTALQTWAGSGGKLLIEGGEVGYDALNSPGYPEFAAQVLHAVDWDTDHAGDLAVAAGMANHPLLNIPYDLPGQIMVEYDGYGDEDAMEPADDAYAVLVPLSVQGDGGVIVHDDNPAPQSAQIVYMAFNIEALDSQTGSELIENALAFLLAPEAPPTASVSGRVTLAGETDHSGVLVDLGDGLTTLTDSDGNWSVSELYAGMYAVIATKDGWSVDRQDIVLTDGQHLADVDFVLSPIINTSYEDFPGLVIPDNDPAGVTTTITVPEAESGAISELTVDVYIQHTWIGDLTVVLTSPAGTSVVLHNRTGAQDDNILGNWPNTLTVDGPGTMADFIGENNAGVWTMFLSDAVGSDEGELSLWRLNFSIPMDVSAAPGEDLPVATRLYPNVPNPFNPLTEIRFDLARSGRVQLDIFDLRGHRVRRLAGGELPAGSHVLRWDGRDDRDRSVSSGTYLYRLRCGDIVQERKMLLVR